MSVSSLLSRLEQVQPVIRRRDVYYRGVQPMRFVAETLSGTKLAGFRSNLCKVAVGAVAERVRLEDVVSASVDGRDVSERARALVRDADLPMVLQSIVTEMLAVGSAYLVVWVDEFGRPVVTGESAEQMMVERDPVTRAVTGAVKRWLEIDHNGATVCEHVIQYRRDRIVHLKREGNDRKLKFAGEVDNVLGVVPVVPLVNIERIHDDVGSSVVDDLAPLIDALNKLILDMLVTSESVARPKRYVTGVALEDDDAGEFMADEFIADEQPISDRYFMADGGASAAANDPFKGSGVRAPFKGSDDVWIAESAEARFGQLPGAGLDGYQTAVGLIMQQVMAVTALPAHLVGVTSANPSSADAIRAAEAGLSSQAASRVRVVDRPLQWAVRLMLALDLGVDPSKVQVRLRWADTATRSVGQAADAAVKLAGEQIVSVDEARALAGAGEEI